MASDTARSNLDYPSFDSVVLFWEKGVEEYETDEIVSQKDGCEKAFRSATEAIDVLLAHNGFYVPVGKVEAHIIREEYLMELLEIKSEIKEIIEQYSTFKNILHGICFYTNTNPKKYHKIFYQVKEFNEKIKSLLQ